jgi:hypothetical protein
MFVPSSTLAANNGGQTVYITRGTTLNVYQNGNCRQTLRLRLLPLRILISPDGRYVAVVLDNFRTAIYFVQQSGQLEQPFYLNEFYGMLNMVAISNRYFYLSCHFVWHVYELDTGQLVNQPLAHDNVIYSASLVRNLPHPKLMALSGPDFLSATWINLSNVQRTHAYMYMHNSQESWVAVDNYTQKQVFVFPTDITSLWAFDSIVLVMLKDNVIAYYPDFWKRIGEVAWSMLYDTLLPVEIWRIVRRFVVK